MDEKDYLFGSKDDLSGLSVSGVLYSKARDHVNIITFILGHLETGKFRSSSLGRQQGVCRVESTGVVIITNG